LSAISRRPPKTLAFTCGDPAGVGPRAVLAAVRARVLPADVEPLLVGEASVWRRAGWRRGDARIHDTGLRLKPPPLGAPSVAGGRMAAAAFEEALRLIGRGLAAGLVTAPISKESWARAGYPWRDHTERLAACGGRGAEMILAVPSKDVWCSLVTRHLSLKDAVRRLGAGAVVSAARALDCALRRLGRRRPRLALCGLNPHAGEAGLIGREERDILNPAAAALRRAGILIDGPLPADSAWRLHVEGACDGLVCLYHDQALIPLKTLGGLSGVNWTVGAPFVRVSPAHGTAWEAACSGSVDASGMIEASRLASILL